MSFHDFADIMIFDLDLLTAKTQNYHLANQSFKIINLLSGDRRKNESYLSWKADIVIKTRNHTTEEAWLISFNSGISSFFVKRLVGVSMYPSMHSGIKMVYNMTRTSLMGKDSGCHPDVPLYTTEFSIT